MSSSLVPPHNSKLATSPHDTLFAYDATAQAELMAKKPWSTNPEYFTTVRISPVALVKMVTHARSGGTLEVMGLMQGHVDGTTLIVTDAFRLPVEGTETRVNAQDEANEYIVEYLSLCREHSDRGRPENPIGWYHSHPGYGCWLSGIDVSTQHVQQTYSDPWVAVVIDPLRTVSSNKVDIGAFRTYPEGHQPAHTSGAAAADNTMGSTSPTSGGKSDGPTALPRAKVEDFGAHSDRYYALAVEHFKGTLDTALLEALWNKYWAQTLSQNALLTNRDYVTGQIRELAWQVKDAAGSIHRMTKGGGAGGSGTNAVVDQHLKKVMREGHLVATTLDRGLVANSIKEHAFHAVQPPSEEKENR